MVALSYLSYMIVDELVKIGQPTLFLNFFFLIIMIIMIFQVILASTNVYFFSRDLEVLLPLPIKTEELLISKCGVCWDQVELERDWFINNDLFNY